MRSGAAARRSTVSASRAVRSESRIRKVTLLAVSVPSIEYHHPWCSIATRACAGRLPVRRTRMQSPTGPGGGSGLTASSGAELQRMSRRCNDVLMQPDGFDAELVGLCRQVRASR